ncbi:c-type cytochrome [Hirschia litorea]|uniref:C-type cytochrome n=1 Tax=Hirschia litorea TaxID=1199156 RepID=A0ABW2IMF8_9PROT
MKTFKIASFALTAFAMTAGFSGSALAEGDAEAGAKVFKKCVACHNVVGANKVGPNLNNILGREIASVEGFKYSKAMLAEGEGGKTWDTESLSAYLANPRAAVKGNKMVFIGLKKEKEQQDVIAYIMSKSE